MRMKIIDFIIVPDVDFADMKRLNPMIALPLHALIGLAFWVALFKLIF